jgi:tetratricopeptide (TPR) repeat protein
MNHALFATLLLSVYSLCLGASVVPFIRPRRRVLRMGLLLVVVVAATGVTLRLVRSRPVPPVPPEAKSAKLEPAVVTAVQVVRERVLKEPRSAQAWGDLGKVFLANEMEEESSLCFAEAERLDPGNPRWPYLLAGPLLTQGEREAALKKLQQAVELCEAEGEANIVPRLLLAETFLTLGRWEEAEPHIRHALGQQPEDPRAQFDRGLLALARQDWETARTHFRLCLANPLTRQRARLQLAAVSLRLGDRSTADELRKEAGRLPPDPDWIDPFITEYLHWAVKKKNRYRLADQLEAGGRFAEAVVVLRPLAADYPDDYLPQLTLGKLLAQTGDFRSAEVALRRALRLAPDKVQTHYYLGLLLLKEGEQLDQGGEGRARAVELFREAASYARQALAIKPDYGFAYMALGLSLKHLGQRSEALTTLRQAVLCNPEFAELHFYLGETLAEEGRGDEARLRLEQALRLAPPQADWRQAAQSRLAQLQKK